MKKQLISLTNPHDLQLIGSVLMRSTVPFFDSVVCCKSFHKRQKVLRAWESLYAAHFPNDKG